MPSRLTTIFIVLSAVGVLAITDSANTTNAEDDTLIHFSLVVSSAPSLNTSGVVTAVADTLELINNDSTILPGYRLYSQVLDSECNGTRAVDLLNLELNSNNTPVAVVGCGCSVATEGVVGLGLDIPVVSYASTSVALSNSSVYPNFFRTVPSDEPLPSALATVMQYYGWRQLSILTEREAQFTKLSPLLETALSTASVTVGDSIQFTNTVTNMSEAANILFEGESRVIFFNTNPMSAMFYLCRAFQDVEERSYPDYVWITPGWYQPEWWKSDEEYLRTLNCSSSDIEQQLNRSLSLLVHPNTGAINITEPFTTDSYAVDAVMALALALNETLVNSSLDLDILSTALKSVKFNGTTGTIEFDANGDRQNHLVLLQQFRQDLNGSVSLHPIAKIEKGNFTYINGEDKATVWTDVRGRLPPIITIINIVTTPVYAYVVTLVTIGVILSIICLVFNIIFRKRKVIKLTSPNLNYVIVFGAIMLQIGNLFLPFPSRNVTLIAVLCTIARIFLSIGYNICFVVALVKTVRVAYIFTNVTPTKKKVQDWQLFLMAAVIVSIEVLFTIPLLTLTYVKGDAKYTGDSENPTFVNDQGYTVTHLIISCGLSTTYIIYFSLALAYKVIIHVIGLVLAFLTRKVRIDALNDSKYSSAIIYCSCVLLVLAVVVVFALSGVNTYAGVWSTLVFVEVCIFLGLTFIPKMVSLYRDPQGEKLFEQHTSQSQSYNVKTNVTTLDASTTKSGTFTATHTVSIKQL